ncbi:hypothetical protein [Paenibacillus ginsengihumi]|uniref:hypothetical protein n=1 Tax=Paenibacillus ginsengihumi TaxID=431596 RepID=UPI0012EC1C1E|nr:hypothetical protein [Paenibacillus ginsengihumi]
MIPNWRRPQTASPKPQGPKRKTGAQDGGARRGRKAAAQGRCARPMRKRRRFRDEEGR